jgi:DNA-binding transcriptional regulator YiaG
MSLANDLKTWRGKRAQKEVCGIFGVSLSTYQAWEQEKNKPSLLAENTIRWLMKPDGYNMVIKHIAAEIQNRK